MALPLGLFTAPGLFTKVLTLLLAILCPLDVPIMGYRYLDRSIYQISLPSVSNSLCWKTYCSLFRYHRVSGSSWNFRIVCRFITWTIWVWPWTHCRSDVSFLRDSFRLFSIWFKLLNQKLSGIQHIDNSVRADGILLHGSSLCPVSLQISAM